MIIVNIVDIDNNIDISWIPGDKTYPCKECPKTHFLKLVKNVSRQNIGTSKN